MPATPEDIYEKIEGKSKASAGNQSPKMPSPVLRPKPNLSPVQPKQDFPSGPGPGLKARWPGLLVGLLVILVGLGAVAILIRGRNSNTLPAGNNNSAAASTTNSNKSTNDSVKTVVQLETAINDKDKDGLSDEKEAELGTNLEVVDTDHDGLSDSDEVNVYKTDPKKPDTDGDGINDGTEVKKGYNPKGTGRLLDFEAAKNKLTNSNTNQ